MDIGFQTSRTVIAGRTGYAVPLIVSVTGHRNLVPAEIPEIRQRVREFLAELCDKSPDRGVSVMSSLAEGADQIVAEEAITLRSDRLRGHAGPGKLQPVVGTIVRDL
jgi:hypothetical protein